MRRKPSLGSIFLTIFLDLLGFGMVLPFLAEEARDTFGATEFQGALIGSVYSLMQFLFVPVWGRLSDRVGRRPVMVWSIFASALGMFGLFAALIYGHSFFWLMAMRCLTGVATANLGTASAYIADITKPEERAKGMGMIGAAFGLGFIFGPGIGGILAPIEINGRHGGIPCLVAAVLNLINFLWVLFGLPESLPKELRSTSKRKLLPLDWVATRNTLRKPGIGRMVLINFVLILAFTNLDQTFRFFNKDVFGMSQIQTGVALMIVGICGALVQGVIVRKASGKIADTSMLRIGLVLQVIGFALLAGAKFAGLWALYVSCVLFAFGNGLSQPSISAYISKRSPWTEQGETLGTNQSFSSLARMFGPAMGGFLYGAIAPSAPYVVASIGMALSLLLTLRIDKMSIETGEAQSNAPYR